MLESNKHYAFFFLNIKNINLYLVVSRNIFGIKAFGPKINLDLDMGIL